MSIRTHRSLITGSVSMNRFRISGLRCVDALFRHLLGCPRELRSLLESFGASPSVGAFGVPEERPRDARYLVCQRDD